LPVDQWFADDQVLRSHDEIAFHHHSNDPPIALPDLFCDIAADRMLFAMIFPAVRVTAIDHQPRGIPAFSCRLST
jgi:hypothetical protein